jgi:hypothetical protein
MNFRFGLILHDMRTFACTKASHAARAPSHKLWALIATTSLQLSVLEYTHSTTTFAIVLSNATSQASGCDFTRIFLLHVPILVMRPGGSRSVILI